MPFSVHKARPPASFGVGNNSDQRVKFGMGPYVRGRAQLRQFMNQEPSKPVSNVIHMGQHTHPYVEHDPRQLINHHGVDMDSLKKVFYDGVTDAYTDAPYKSGVTKNAMGKKVFVKPSMLHTSWTGEADTNRFSSAHREALFHNMAHNFFGLGKHVPTTSAFIHKGHHYSAQEVIPNARPGYNIMPHISKQSKLLKDGTLHKIAVMDAVLGNNDRHAGNYLFTGRKNPSKYGTPQTMHNKIHLIDHGLAFNYTSHDRLRGLEGIRDLPFSKDTQKWIHSLNPDELETHMYKGGAPDHVIAAAKKTLVNIQRSLKSVSPRDKPTYHLGVEYSMPDTMSVRRSRNAAKTLPPPKLKESIIHQAAWIAPDDSVHPVMSHLDWIEKNHHNINPDLLTHGTRGIQQKMLKIGGWIRKAHANAYTVGSVTPKSLHRIRDHIMMHHPEEKHFWVSALDTERDSEHHMDEAYSGRAGMTTYHEPGLPFKNHQADFAGYIKPDGSTHYQHDYYGGTHYAIQHELGHPAPAGENGAVQRKLIQKGWVRFVHRHEAGEHVLQIGYNHGSKKAKANAGAFVKKYARDKTLIYCDSDNHPSGRDYVQGGRHKVYKHIMGDGATLEAILQACEEFLNEGRESKVFPRGYLAPDDTFHHLHNSRHDHWTWINDNQDKVGHLMVNYSDPRYAHERNYPASENNMFKHGWIRKAAPDAYQVHSPKQFSRVRDHVMTYHPKVKTVTIDYGAHGDRKTKFLDVSEEVLKNRKNSYLLL